MYNIFKYLWINLYLNVIGFWKSCQEQIWDRHQELPDDLPNGEGQTVVITGGNRGIGWEAVKTLLKLGYHVIIGSRRPAALEPILKDFAENKGSFTCLQLDLTSTASVRRFAAEVNKHTDKVNVLANNAGIMFGSRRETEDGFEQQMGVNYMSHFLLTHLLLPLLRNGGTREKNARIVNVSSCAHYVGSWIDLDDIHGKKFYCAEGAYGNSKAAQILCTKYLNSILESDESCFVRAFCLHPGVVKTDLYENAKYVKILDKLVCNMMMKTAPQGGDTVVFTAISPEIEGRGGLYLENSRVRTPSAFVRSLENQLKLWRITCDQLGIQEFGKP